MEASMVRLLAGLLLACFALPAQAQGPRVCDHESFFYHAIATGPVEIVPADAAKRVYSCGFFVTDKANTLDLTMMVGQGTNCATNQTVIFTLVFPNDASMSNRIDYVGPVLGDLSYALCIQTTGTGTLHGIIYWAQF
jgi:hypothetical protein